MRYQLVFQFKGDSLADFDQMVSLEDALIGVLGATAEVDGHDVGSGETNIFIFTTDPAATFQRAKPVLESQQQFPALTAAYRPVNGERYRVIWPEGSQDADFSVA